MMAISREEYMKKVGVTEEELSSLKELDFKSFIKIKKGDVVYRVGDWNYFIPLPWEVVSAKWLKVPDGIYPVKYPYYLQIAFRRNGFICYADSLGHNYKDLFIRKS